MKGQVDIRLDQHIKANQEVSVHSEDEELQEGLVDCEATKKNKKPRRRNRKKKAKSAEAEENLCTNPPESVPSPEANQNTPNCIETRDFMTTLPHPLYNQSRVLPYLIETQQAVEGANTEDENGSIILMKKVVMEENAALKAMANLNKTQLLDLKMKAAEEKATIEKLKKEVTMLSDRRKEDAKELAILTERLKRLASRWDTPA